MTTMASRIRGINKIFLLTVLIPTFASVIYYSFFASSIYVSESQFVVRSPERQAASAIGALFRTAGFARAQDDSYSVQEYVLSRDALAALQRSVDVRKSYASKDVDLFSRFGGLGFDDGNEELHRFYQKMVQVQTDGTSSITTLKVKAFSAEDALKINTSLLAASESLVNRLNERGRNDLVRFSQTEVSNAEMKAKAAALALSAYRNQQGVVDPERQATLQLQQVAKLQDELVISNTQLAQLKTFTPQNPQIPSLQNRIKSLEAEMEKENAKATGGQKSLANKAVEFQRLLLESEFSNKQLASALVSLENAKNEAQRQQVYLEKIALPSKPDSAEEPRRFRIVLSTFLLGLLSWGILTMLIAGIKEHKD